MVDQMARKPEKPTYAFIRRGNSLVPEMEFDARALEGIKNGERVKVEIRQWRNTDRNRAYWAMLAEVVAATDCALSPERLHEVVKIETGCIELVQLPTGMKVAIPGSVAFDKMEEAEFITFFRRAEEWLAATFGYVSERKAA